MTDPETNEKYCGEGCESVEHPFDNDIVCQPEGSVVVLKDCHLSEDETSCTGGCEVRPDSLDEPFCWKKGEGHTDYDEFGGEFANDPY